MDKYAFTDKEYPVLQKAYTKEEIEKMADEVGYIEGVVKVSLDNLIDNDLEGFLDTLSLSLIDSVCLMDINYKLVGCCENGTGLILARGQAEAESE
ncbi:MAG: hypothetical protein LBV12_11830 [Puniceicoccales bacterium]|jgi:hypothetical protein|nr:hypothetical protein [Puniceicoccales bacterium]